MRVVPQIGNEMWRSEFGGEFFLPRLRPLSVNELEEIEPDPDAVDAN